MATAAQIAAVNRYQKKHMRRFVFIMHKTYDADIIEFLESKENMTGYFKELIRKEIAAQ